MKKLLLVVGVLVLLLAGAVVAAPFLIPSETIKAQLAQQVEGATGRKLAVDGELDLAIIPNVAVRMSDVRFANAPGSDVADMVTLDELRVGLKVLPLLTGAVEVSEFVLVEPEIYLEIDAEGKPNWDMAGAGGEATTSEPVEQESGEGLPVSEVKLGDIRIENGNLTYVDRPAGTEERIEAIDVTFGLEDLSSPFSLEGGLAYKGENIDLDLDLSSPASLLEGGQSPLKIGVKSALLQLGFAGDVKYQGLPSVAGDIDLAVSSIRQLAAWLAEPIDLEGEALEQLTIAGKLNGSAERVAFTEATINLDQIQGQGEVTAELAGVRPKVTGRLDLGPVDLNPYLPASEAEQSEGETASSEETTAETGAEGEAAPAGAKWSDDPIELPPLDAADLTFELTMDRLFFQDLKLDRTVLGISLADNTLVADLKEFGLYDGTGSGQLSLQVIDGRPTIENNFDLAGLNALPFLTDAAEFDRLEGIAQAEFGLTTSGGSQRELVGNLNGQGKVVFADGAISGINVAAMVRNASTAFLSAEAGEERKTDFAELSGSFTIQNGMLSNQDLTLQAPALRIAGSGTADLPSRQVDYRIDPLAAATLEGQGGETDVSGILVPVVITGPFHDLSYRPDLSGVIDQAINDPKALEKQVKQQFKDLGGSRKDLKKQLKSIDKDDAKNLLEGLASGDEDATNSPAGKLIKGLFD